jgi:hypothetical protein
MLMQMDRLVFRQIPGYSLVLLAHLIPSLTHSMGLQAKASLLAVMDHRALELSIQVHCNHRIL